MNAILFRKTSIALLLALFFSFSASAIETTNEDDAAKRAQGCEMAHKISTGSKTPGQMTAEESISYNYLKSVDAERFQLCTRNTSQTAVPRATKLQAYPYQGKISYIAEGNVLALSTGQKFNLLGIRILEGKNSEAKEYLKNMLVSHDVELRYDAQKTDRFKRLQGYAYLGNTFINRALIEAGFAEAKSMPPNTSRDAILSRPLSEPEPVISEPYDDEAMAREMRQHQLRMVYMMTGGLVAAMVIGVGLRKWLKK